MRGGWWNHHYWFVDYFTFGYFAPQPPDHATSTLRGWWNQHYWFVNYFAFGYFAPQALLGPDTQEPTAAPRLWRSS